jgi:hypothetical protein
MKKIICFIFGHKWKYVENMIPDVADYVCVRCGKFIIKRIK